MLLRAAEVVEGHELVASRRPAVRRPVDAARGPGNLGAALGLTLDDDGLDLFGEESGVSLELCATDVWNSGPRVGISVAPDWPWRLWIPGSPAVSSYRRSPRAPAPT